MTFLQIVLLILAIEFFLGFLGQFLYRLYWRQKMWAYPEQWLYSILGSLSSFIVFTIEIITDYYGRCESD